MPNAAPRGTGSPPGRWGFRLYALHLLTLPSIAVANGFAGLTVLATPWAARGRRFPAAARPLLAALAIYAAALVASILVSYQPAHSLRTISELFTLATLPLALLLLRGRRDAERVVTGLVVVATLSAAMGLAQFAFGYGGLDQRIRGPFSHWMTFAHFLLVCDCLLIGRMAAGPRSVGWRRAARWVALAVINLAIVGSLTRSVWVALAIVVTLVVAVRAPRWLALWLGAAALAVMLAPAPLRARIVSVVDLDDPSNYDRLCMLVAGGRMIGERPLLGIGPDMVEQRYPIYREPTAPRFSVPHLHNNLLQLAAERGLPALAAYLAMTLLALAAAARGLGRLGGLRAVRAGPDTAAAGLHLGALLALVAFNLGGMFEFNWGDTEVQRLALFALALPFCTGDRRASSVSEPSLNPAADFPQPRWSRTDPACSGQRPRRGRRAFERSENPALGGGGPRRTAPRSPSRCQQVNGPAGAGRAFERSENPALGGWGPAEPRFCGAGGLEQPPREKKRTARP